MRIFSIFFFLFPCSIAFAQLSENFSDGDFSNNPAWSGDATSFTINAGQLQSNGPNATATISLSTPNTRFSNTEWDFYVNLAFSPSDANHARIYLMSDQADLHAPTLNGYFIRFGENGSADGIDLWKQQGTTLTKIVDGLPGTVAINPAVRVRVIRDLEGNWQVWADAIGGTDFSLQGSTKDNAVQETSFFGVSCIHTTTNRQKFFFDDFQITEAPIALVGVTAIQSTQIKIQFSKSVELSSAQDVSNYELDNGLTVVQATQESAPAQVRLTLGSPMAENIVYTLKVNNVQGADASVIIPNSVSTFTYTAPVNSNDLIITEIFADETPAVGLPVIEFVEIYNRTNHNISLHGLRFSDDGSSTAFPDSVIRPKEYVILCSHASVNAFASFGKVIGLASFSLNNSGETLGLQNAPGQLIFSVTYSDTWYKSSVKQEGGWSLEMIDTNNPCGEAGNWVASENAKGGTPGKANSVAAAKPDLTPPQLLRVEVVSPLQLKVVFDEKLDSLSTTHLSSYQLDKGATIISTAVISPQFRQVLLSLNPGLSEKTTYTLSLNGLTDCNGNLIAANTQSVFVLPQVGDSADVVLNEVLFNPHTGGVDFVEIYNRSAKYVTLKDWQLANVADGIVANAKAITTDDQVIAPGQYYALATNSALLKSHYPKSKEENFLVMASLPSYSDASGTVVLLNPVNKLLDRFDYNEDWHFPLIRDKSGVSLERISFDSKANDPAGWHSAATTEDYATPGYRNSQFQLPTANAGGVAIDPRVFTPDEDGLQDFTTLSYAFAKGGNVANIRVFDVRGREVKLLAQNQTLGTEGYFRWDGTDNRGEKVRTGYYVVYVELFDLHGQTQVFKEKVVVGAKF
ncbi:MAG: lamin tail domain-containing protein [Bacteroidota bacterium]